MLIELEVNQPKMEASSNSAQVIREFKYGISVVYGYLNVNGSRRGPGHWVEFNGVPLTTPDKEQDTFNYAKVFEKEFEDEERKQARKP